MPCASVSGRFLPQEHVCFWHSETAGASAGNPEALFKKTPATGKAADSLDVKKSYPVERLAARRR